MKSGMGRFRCILSLLAVLLAAPAFAADSPFGAPSTVPSVTTPDPELQDPNNVQEPDADDGTMEEIKPVPPAPVAGQTAKDKLKPETPPKAEAETDFNAVSLRVLNKVTARSESLEAPIGSVVQFGTIEIVAHKCWKSAPEDRPENAALIEISEVKQGEAPKQIFLGWMFSSSPGLSALENPFYDVTVIECSTVKRE